MCKKEEAKTKKTSVFFSQTSTGKTTPYYYDIDDDEERLLVEQIKYLHSERCSIQSSFLTIISVALGAYGLIIYQALSYDKTLCGKVNYVFILLPFLFAMSFYNVIKYTIRMLGINAYIRYLEGTINNKHKKALFQWYSYLIQAKGSGIIGGIAQFPLFVPIVLFVSQKFMENYEKIKGSGLFADIILVMLICEVLVLVIMLILCITESQSTWIKCSELADEHNAKK